MSEASVVAGVPMPMWNSVAPKKNVKAHDTGMHVTNVETVSCIATNVVMLHLLNKQYMQNTKHISTKSQEYGMRNS